MVDHAHSLLLKKPEERSLFPMPPKRPHASTPDPSYIVGVGASAGGFEAFKEFFKALPADTGMAFVLITHLNPTHASVLPELLSKLTKLSVHHAKDGMKVLPNKVYVLPPDSVLLISGGKLKMKPRPSNGFHLPIDAFFGSLAQDQQSQAVGIILSGMGSDGTLGMDAIRNEGGITFAQDKKTSKFNDMPSNAAASGGIDFILPPKQIAAQLAAISKNPSRKMLSTQKTELSEKDESLLREIFAIILKSTGMDFTHYKYSTILRRITRRTSMQRIDDLGAYVRYLKKNPEEVRALHDDLLISVTNFFRDPAVFAALKRKVFPAFMKKRSNVPIRVWVSGCSTGEEAYSMAICLLEFLGSRSVPVQIFATDMRESDTIKARAGVYPAAIRQHVSPERLRRFFTKTGEGYQVNKSIRSLCVFARHNVLRDPPYSNMDLISCRNVLIYMENILQDRVMPVFHYSLKKDGFLLLGNSESTGRFTELFKPYETKHRIFLKKASALNPLHLKHSYYAPSVLFHEEKKPAHQQDTLDIQKEADRLVLAKHSAPGVLITEDGAIQQFRGQTAPYILPAPGNPSANLFKMVHDEILTDVQQVLHQAKKNNAPAKKENIIFKYEGTSRTLDLEAIPIKLPRSGAQYFLLFFKEKSRMKLNRKEKNSRSAEKERESSRLRQQLADSKDSFRSFIEEHAKSDEEFRVTNEELQSLIEEQKSTNEELETAKEELQSGNEELVTLNDELGRRNKELNQLNNQLTRSRNYNAAIVNTLWEPILVLDSNLKVKTANASFYREFRTTPAETEKHLIYELGNGQWNIPKLRELLEKILPKSDSFLGFEVTHDFPVVGRKTMLLNASKIDSPDSAASGLILLAMQDITQKKAADDELRRNKASVEHSNKELEQFAYVVSHDLQEPLRKIIVFGNRLKPKCENLDEPDKGYFQKIQGAATRMKSLIEDLLDLSKVSGDKKVYETVALADVVQDVILDLEAKIEMTRGVVEVGELPTIDANRLQMRQLFQNLISNSLKFAKKNEPCRIRITARNFTDGFVEIAVRDNGIGFDEKYTDRILQPFQRLHNKHEYEGTGIGLAVCQKVVKSHGGEISVKSKPGEGATFLITLPERHS